MNKVNLFATLTALFPMIHLSNLFIEFGAAFEAIWLTNSSNLSLAK